ncbi:MAG: Rrf2 family transcriptional regulator [Bryobacterales bacterium]|jgi:Rrf2 family transcriptional regulator, nitric oxide-sensitive transcriptional repressor|nr:Rrf2 family transcriptional regulator [Bryobacterales bacterium]
MYLTRQADYTMRLLIHLAVQPSGVATIQQIAGHYGISRNHLMKVANRAAQAGYVEGVRGRLGGLKLAKRANEINVGHVLRATEDWTLVECFEPESNRCPIAGGCGLQVILKEALEAFFMVLDRYSLADVVRRKTLLVQLLSLRTA